MQAVSIMYMVLVQYIDAKLRSTEREPCSHGVNLAVGVRWHGSLPPRGGAGRTIFGKVEKAGGRFYHAYFIVAVKDAWLIQKGGRMAAGWGLFAGSANLAGEH